VVVAREGALFGGLGLYILGVVVDEVSAVRGIRSTCRALALPERRGETDGIPNLTPKDTPGLIRYNLHATKLCSKTALLCDRRAGTRQAKGILLDPDGTAGLGGAPNLSSHGLGTQGKEHNALLDLGALETSVGGSLWSTQLYTLQVIFCYYSDTCPPTPSLTLI
jgi:hypothetical protein